MKYGQTLHQRSIPEWSHYNVDYDDIKRMIKMHTTPDSGGAVSIPGQGGGIERSFEDALYGILLEQHQLIDLFVRSKIGEIQRRLGSLEKQIRQMNDRLRATRVIKITAKRLERYARLENDILRAGNELRSLSRYIGAQRLAFSKLLKKYKKWTHSEVLVQRFKTDLNKSGSFSTIDLAPLLAKWAEALQDVRAPFEPAFYRKSADHNDVNLRVPSQPQLTISTTQKFNESQATNSQQPRLRSPSTTVIDTAFATTPRDIWRRVASYWVHYDNIVELQVLLLHHMRLLLSSNSDNLTSQSSSTQFRGKSATASQPPSPLDSEDDLNTIVIEDPHYLSEEQNSRYSSVDAPPLVRLSVRYNSSSEATVSLQPKADCALDGIISSKLKVKYLASFLDTQIPFRRSSSVPGTPISEMPIFDFGPTDDAIRDWIRDNPHVKPLVGICSKRTHFTGLERDSAKSVWAVLDRNISLSRMKSEDLSNYSSMSNLRLNSKPFPHAVLHIRQMSEGADAIIQELDQSHLVERIPGFSIETHALWDCCRPQNMQPPHWISKLTQDIRKVPVTHGEARRTSHSFLNATSLDQKDGTSSRVASAPEPFESSDTAVSLPKPGNYAITSEHKEANANNPRKRRRAYAEASPLARNSSEQRYWNEYDDPEDGHDDAYVIWVDPHSGTSFKQWFGKLLPSWHRTRSATDTRTHPSGDNTSTTEDGLPDDSSSSSSSSSAHTSPRKPWSYGTFNPFKLRAHSHPAPPSRSRTYSNRMHTHTTALLPPLEADPASTTARYERIRGTLTVLTFSASTTILAVVCVLAATGRHKQAYEVDAGILFGIVVNLVFACVGLGCLVSGRSTSWVGWCGGLVLFAVICVGNGGLCAWLVS